MIKNCTIKGCPRKHFGRGWCNTHYRRWYIHGDPTHEPMPPNERFWRFVQKTATCWIWTGAAHRGYGKFQVNGRCVGAHRYSLFLATGTMPTFNQPVLHSCDNPSCVNPAHLREGTASENMFDRSIRGRRPNHQGEKHPYSKLTNDDIYDIRHLIKQGLNYAEIAVKFGVSRHHISRIKTGKAWSHI